MSFSNTIFDLLRLEKITKTSRKRNELKLIKCPNVGCEKVFSHRIKKRDLDSNKCLGIPVTKALSKTVEEDGVYICKLCKTQIKHQNNVSRHRKLCKGKKIKPEYLCLTCGKKFMYLSQFTIHSNIHTGESYVCDRCEKTFKRIIFKIIIITVMVHQ